MKRSEARAAVGLKSDKRDEVYSTEVRAAQARLTADAGNPGEGNQRPAEDENKGLGHRPGRPSLSDSSV